MRRWITFVLVSFAVLFALVGVVFAVRAFTWSAPAPQRPPQPPGVLECDTPDTKVSDPVCVAWFKHDRRPITPVFVNFGVAALLGVVALAVLDGWDRAGGAWRDELSTAEHRRG